MKKLFMAVIALMMTISASAQFYIYCSDGNVIKVDSISMVVPEDLEEPTPTAGIGIFTVAADKQVSFSKGNLQYHPANDEWRFAENQTDYIGDANNNCSSTYNGWLDLFGWSTRSTNFGVSTSKYASDYSGSFVDWGTNKIGTDAPYTWRTLTRDEWEVLLYYRKNASALFGVAQVNGVNGLILLPDNWTVPVGITFKPGLHSKYVADYSGYQSFTAEQWQTMEQAGAVFLPPAGTRGGSSVNYMHYYGCYWSSIVRNGSCAYNVELWSNYLTSEDTGSERCNGHSVRLVKDL